MYEPVKDGVDKSVHSFSYTETKPPEDLSDYVHSYWERKTLTTLPDDFRLHALPDACVNILFDQADTRIAGITVLRTTYEVLSLGKEFHYAGIQLMPGVWQGNQNETTDSFVGTPYTGNLPLIETSIALAKVDTIAKLPILSKLVHLLIGQDLVTMNVLTAAILAIQWQTLST
ncbi:MAG: DUF6597 domain-containing transcriptional factor [Granulosicoccus sp.]